MSPFKREVAVKNVWTDTAKSQKPGIQMTDALPEIQILKKLHHPAISNLLFFYTRQANEKVITRHLFCRKVRKSGIFHFKKISENDRNFKVIGFRGEI